MGLTSTSQGWSTQFCDSQTSKGHPAVWSTQEAAFSPLHGVLLMQRGPGLHLEKHHQREWKGEENHTPWGRVSSGNLQGAGISWLPPFEPEPDPPRQEGFSPSAPEMDFKSFEFSLIYFLILPQAVLSLCVPDILLFILSACGKALPPWVLDELTGPGSWGS